ncbi:3-oxoacyl-[acyl-carrier-protein] reductase [Micromonospora andamanensis]|uniref:SDR family NAD(P)-dependent oxidoreductase n=1 Tax=Micromonospora andamanensis TaxID=1287068 RepID=UPI00194DC809|nr:SDR family oxidoreductase [Micromonospora andamanensis]GIJ41634.1 beta-ketoacyl-ACP reductase [Micromonospora andamanensis]
MFPTAAAQDLTGRVALVTGANHGIGAATAVALARLGTAVLVSYLRLDDPPNPGIPDAYRRNRAADATGVVERVRAVGGRVVPVEADLADPAVPARLFDVAERELGTVDILVNNASGWLADTFKPAAADRHGRTLRQVSAESFDAQFAVDARAGALLIAEFARRNVAARRGWGRVISLTSGGNDGFPEEVSYGAAKAALVNYTMAAARELAPFGITANAVHPPVTDTGWVSEEVRAAVDDDPHLLRVAEPEEVAEVIAFLAGERGRLVTGNVVQLR